MVRRFSSTVEASDLRLARTLLQKARPELEQRQWDLLNEKLLAVEQAWERYEAARPAKSDQREKASSPSLALAGMGTAAEGASLAPLLVLLAAFWSADTAGPGMDPPRWQGPLLDYEGKQGRHQRALSAVHGVASSFPGGLGPHALPLPW